MDTTLSVLKDYFGFMSFRPYQREVIEKIIEKRDCLVVMATGSGKSLCYQVPPLVVKKTGIVVSPLISLMQDQVMALKQRGIKAEYLSSAQKDYTVQSKAERGQFDILFMTPEKACTIPTSFWSNLLKEGISLFAVDEAHCISEWGHDFRVEYKQLDKLRGVLFDVPYVGLTATATEKVRFDITNSLKMNNPYVVVGSFDRPNLFYGVKQFNRGQSFIDEIVEEISKEVANGCSTIIYCTTIKDVEQIHKSLTEVGVKHAPSPSLPFSLCLLLKMVDAFENQKKAVMESLLAAQRYCLSATCRRKFLLEHFGEKIAADRCGNCDNCTVSKKERDLSREAFLLMACIHSCKGRWGLNMPIDILRGSRAKKIIDAQYDRLPLHGIGKTYQANWWKALGHQLISLGYLKEIVNDMFRTVRPDYQPPLVLPLVGELEEDENRSTEEFKNVAASESQGFSEVVMKLCYAFSTPFLYFFTFILNEAWESIVADGKLYQMLLEERLKLARSVGTAPYALCGDQTIKRIALTRPSTKARLANIDGVNQHLVTRYGDYFIHAIQKLSNELNLSLDGEVSLQTNEVRKVSPIVTNKSTKLQGAKFEAWKMWHEEGLSIQKIANFPGRAAPIQEQTVAQYLLDAAQEGLPFDWTRFCEAIGLKQDFISAIQAAIVKVGATDKLKPIKNELPEEITYPHIKAYLTMQTCGISLEDIQPEGHQSVKDGEAVNNASDLSEPPLETPQTESNLEADISTKSLMEIDAVPSGPVNGCQVQKLPLACEGEFTSKRLKVSETEEVSLIKFKATESSVVEWLKNHDEGANLNDILEHFNGSNEDSIVELLSCLECDFLIYKKGNMYRAM
ncbi:hypothetical protein TSUD_124230 [Trifolium subterraneum]|uniref:ATP-dependent DNA helicase n=1 Tax=Trifolium subterraneum TaxID=3900 RepID=A0A2Z6LL78_TRISU|nr:hypothetical protein TSUD_124230 [Trifolium subterraneum]